MHRPATKKRTVSPIYLDDDGINQSSDKVILRTWERPTSLVKTKHDLLSSLPDTLQFIDVYGTSHGISFSKQPAKVETYNDIHGDVHNFFRVLRNNHDDFHDGKLDDPNVARAYAFYAEAKRWGCNSVQELVDRFMRIQIENRPALDILRVYDTPDALFLIEIPYLVKDGNPVPTMTEEDKENLKDALSSLQGKVAVVGLGDDMDLLGYEKQPMEGITLWKNYEVDPPEQRKPLMSDLF